MIVCDLISMKFGKLGIGCSVDGDCEEGMKCNLSLRGLRTFSKKFGRKKFEKRSRGRCIPELTETKRPGTDSKFNVTKDTPMTDSQNNLVTPSK